jgi:hypothetical protein
MDEITPIGQDPNTLQYYIERRNGRKRDYIFDYSKSRTCDHPSMKALARGGNVYRCLECNYAFHINGAYQQPLHNEAILAAFTLFNFAKEFGRDSLAEVLRRPIGQSDGSMHKPVLPEGKSFMDVLEALEGVNVTSPDGGYLDLKNLIGDLWEGQAALEGAVDGDTNKALIGDRAEE